MRINIIFTIKLVIFILTLFHVIFYFFTHSLGFYIHFSGLGIERIQINSIKVQNV